MTRQGVGRYHRRLLREVLAGKGTVCHLCRRPGADSIDHLIPHSAGGAYTYDNLMPAHRVCNSMRGDMPLAEWFTRHPVNRRPPAAPSREW